jgi:hypothetical protein
MLHTAARAKLDADYLRSTIPARVLSVDVLCTTAVSEGYLATLSSD